MPLSYLPITATPLAAADPRWVCGVTTHATAKVCRQPNPHFSVTPPYQHPTIPNSEILQSLQRALALWNETDLVKIEPPNAALPTGITQQWQNIDGPGKILAWSTLPCDGIPCRQAYDTDETWDTGPEPQTTQPSLWLVIAHEIGHALGLPHGPDGNLMAPYYNAMNTRLGPWDIEELQKRYAENPPTPEPPPMNRILQCIINVLPQFISCLAAAERNAINDGQRTPLEDLATTLKRLQKP